MTPRPFLPLFAAVAGASAAEPPAAPGGPPIVVTALPLDQTERALAACLARHCPPEEDIDASLGHAETLFVAGRLREAHEVTQASLRRNRGFARQHPVAVSDLYRADSRIAAHVGDRNGYYHSSWGIRRALREGLPEEDPRLVVAEIELAGMFAALGPADSARRRYESAARKAEAIGRPGLAALARARLAWFELTTGNDEQARRELQALGADRRPEAQFARFTALALLARLDREAGRTASSEALIAAVRAARLPRPVLLFAPPIDLEQVKQTLSGGGDEPYWADIGFTIGPEGGVAEIDVLRSHGTTGWLKPLLASISARIYSRAEEASGQGSYRVERYSFTAFVGGRAGSRVRGPGPARIEYLDLTEPTDGDPVR